MMRTKILEGTLPSSDIIFVIPITENLQWITNAPNELKYRAEAHTLQATKPQTYLPMILTDYPFLMLLPSDLAED